MQSRRCQTEIRTRHGSWIIDLFLLATWGWAAADAAQRVQDVTMTLGSEWGVIREAREVSLSEGLQEIRFEGVPAEADLSSVMLRSRRIALAVNSWGWAGEPGGRGAAPGLSLSEDGRSVRWAPGRPAAPAGAAVLPGPGTLCCAVESPVSGVRSLELIYRTAGLPWQARYRARVRGATEKEGDARLSVDLWGTAIIGNGTSRSYFNALVQLVGPAGVPGRKAREAPGFLMLSEDSPLADLWRGRAAGAEPDYAYRVPRRVNLPARTSTEVSFVAAQRVPAARVYGMDAERIPLTVHERGQPLRSLIVFTNSTANGLGWALPPGPVDITVGSARSDLGPSARIPYAPVDAEIVLDLGDAPEVFGRRQSIGRVAIATNLFEDTYALVIENTRAVPVEVRVEERPPLTLKWDVVSSSEPYGVEEHVLRLKPTVAPRSEKRIEYRIRVHQPSL